MTDITALSAPQDEADHLALRRTRGLEIDASRISEHIPGVALETAGVTGEH